MGLEFALWRALVVFRVAALGYAAVLVARNFDTYAWPAGGWLVLAVMTLWTVVTILAYAVPPRDAGWKRGRLSLGSLRRGWPLYVADLLVSAGCLLASRWIVAPHGVALGSPTLPMAWVAGAVVAWGIAGGRRLGALAAIVMGVADTVVRNGFSQGTINGTVLMLLAGVVVGHLARIAVDTEARLQRAVELEAATRERERLARGIHDSVLQVLALVQRRGAEIGGEAAELGRLAGEQEATLRALVAGGVDAAAASLTDMRTVVDRYAAPNLTIAAPASPVWLPSRIAEELAAAVGSAVDNVRAHAGADAKAWLLLEDEPDAVTISVRDNGRGMDGTRLAEAESAGRLGVAQSIRGRVRDLGGTVQITSEPGRGTEVELRVPRPIP
jgi:signal transduction histidine kinase